jgi:UDP-N-acetylmuramoyl-L-alanyl-D-glutamate--2,6-diaminopimelate ligase
MMTIRNIKTSAPAKLLRELIDPADIIAFAGNLDVEITGVTNDSRRIEKGNCFVAVKGLKEDGFLYVDAAVKQGAFAVVSQQKPVLSSGNVTWVQVKNDRRVFSRMAARFYNNIADDFYSVGVTGTNAKTTITTLVSAILEQESKTASIGTLGMFCAGSERETKLTTPEAADIYKFLYDARKYGCENLVMEVSSVALRLYRVEDIKFSQAIFTTFSGDHLDFHQTMEEYFESKLLLFKKLQVNDWAVINIDDPSAPKIMEHLNCKYLTYGFSEDADVRPLDFKCSVSGIQALLQTPRGELKINSSLIGRINLSNIMAAVTSAVIKGISFENIATAVNAFKAVKGRLDFAYKNDFSVLIDYAHTDKALEALLQSLREMVPGRVIVVFGAGGSRDKTKRPRMGTAASDNADFVFVTSDNPRQEDPRAIIKDILEGFKPGFKDYVVEPDRETAIKKALEMARKGDLVAVAGKGHEDYQIFKDKTIHFDDYEVVRKLMKKNIKEKNKEKNAPVNY